PFSHKGMETEYELSPAVCSRNAHPRNEQRERQRWTNWQLRELIANLKKRGVPTYLSMFTCYYRGKYGPEWLCDHEELTEEMFPGNYRFNPIAALNDGTPCEKIFAPKVAELCRDYGFAGFHGADRFNSTGLLYRRVVTDVLTRMFLQRTGLRAPSYVTAPCRDDEAKQKKRMSWIWGEHRNEITRFIKDRWQEFWREVASNVHAVGGQCLMNSSYTRGSETTAAWLGIDYKEIVEAGVDAIVCETVPLSMSNQAPLSAWQSFPDLHRHFHAWCLTAMQEIRAYLPNTRLMFLHGCKDVVEDWDNIRQSPAGYERELFALASLCHYRKGILFPAADGLTACLADGFSESDWKFITDRWKSAIRPDELLHAGEMVFVWDDRMVSDGVDDYFRDYFPTAFDTIYKFKYSGFAIQSTSRSDELTDVHEPLCIPVAHLLGHEALAKIVNRPEPVVLIGRSDFLEDLLPQGVAFRDPRLTVLILNAGTAPSVNDYPAQDDSAIVNESLNWKSTLNSFTAVMPQMGVATELWQDAFDAVHKVLDDWKKRAGRFFPMVENPTGECQLLTREFSEGRLETIVESLVIRNQQVSLRYSQPFDEFRITSSYPFYPIDITDNSMLMRTSANRGLCAVEVRHKTNSAKKK
ncbi:MAG: hypothetical protein IJS15_02940, partial [Victivallales bacterium]|nr:hypothetical protein [Victivallales bacterium]